MSAIECFTSSTATTIDVALLDKEAVDGALIYSIGLDLQKENDALKQRIKRLEEAGDEIEMILLQYASRAELPRTMAIEQSDLSKRLCVNWRKAKEDKL